MSEATSAAAAVMLQEAQRHFDRLLSQGCSVEVARDRTWDAFECAFYDTDRHCFDPRDRLAEAAMRKINREESRHA